MPNWRKVIVSGSNASLNSLIVSNGATVTGSVSVTGSNIVLAQGSNLITHHVQAAASNGTEILNNTGGVVALFGAGGSQGTTFYGQVNGTTFSGSLQGTLTGTASYASQALSSSYAPSTPTFPYTGSAIISGSLEITGSFNVDTSIDSVNKWLIGTGPIPGSTATAVGWGNRILFDTTGVTTSVDWMNRTLANSSGINNVNWENRTLTGPGPILTSTETAIDWNARELVNSSGVATLNWETGQFTGTASYATQALSASWAPGGGATFPYNGDAQISGSLGVTGSFSVQDSIDSANKILIGLGPMPGSTQDSVNWDNRTLFDSNGNFSVRWGGLRTLFDASAVNSVAWDTRITKDSADKQSIDWQNRQLKNSSETIVLNWSSGVTIPTSLTVSGSFIVQGGVIPGFPPLIPDIGPYDAIKVDDINGTRMLYGTTNLGSSASIDFGNRDLLDNTGNGVLNWAGDVGILESSLYVNNSVRSNTRDTLIATTTNAGLSLGDVTFDSAVQTNDLVYLNTDGEWYQVDQTTDTSTKMLGICKGYNPMTYVGAVITEGDIIVTTGSGYPVVANVGYGLPVYIASGSGTTMSTTIPTTGYVRLLGHCYHNVGTEWIMKFRPSHEWIDL